MKKNNHQSILLIVSVLFQIYFTNISAQTQLFSGKLSAGGFTGTAEYPFRVVNGDSIPEGSFLMYKSNVNALLKEKDSFFSFSGNFKEGYPDGFWKFQFGEFSSNEASQVVGYQYRVNVSGIQHDALGNLSKGKPDGDWIYKISKIENSEVSQVLFNSKISYSRGIPQKSFQIENDTSTLVGRFLRDGFAHDVWEAYSESDSETSESWFFDNGVLKKIEINNSEGLVTIPVFDAPMRRSKAIILDARYLQLIQWNLQNKQAELELNKTNMFRLLQQNVEYYQSIDAFFNDLGKSQFMPGFKTTVPHYPLDSLESFKVEEISKLYQASLEISEGLLNNPQFGLLARSNPKAAYYYQVVEKLKQEFLQPVAEFLNFKDDNLLEFIPMNALGNQIWPQGLPQKRIQLSSTDDAYSSWELEADHSYTSTVFNLSSLEQMLHYAKKSLEIVSDDMSERLEMAEKKQQFLNLDEQLVKKTKILEQNIDSLLQKTNLSIQKALNGILETKETLLKSYAEMEESDAKLEFGKNTLECLDNLGTLASALGQLPEKGQLIDEKYQDAVWNPFTATIMDEAVKKRITSAYRNVLVPYILETVSAPIACENTVGTTQLLADIQKRLMELREEPTKKLERKLRKEQNPEVILELLGIVSNLKTSDR